MTLDEANIIAMIMSTADSGCSTCAGDLISLLAAQFPQFEFRDKEDGELIAPNTGRDLDWEAFEVTVTER